MGLFEVYRDSKNESLLEDMVHYAKERGPLGIMSKELLLGMQAAAGRFSEARNSAAEIRSNQAGTEYQIRALILMASLAGFAESERVGARQALNELRQRFASSVDAGLLAALRASGGDDGTTRHLYTGTGQHVVELSNYPNPFNPSTTIQFDLPQASFVRLRVFDLLGREAALVKEEQMPAGRHAVRFDASNLSSGVHLYRIEAGPYVETRRMLLLK